MQDHKFTFERGRGLVWVCDIEGSSKFLNDDVTVAAIEEFLPRFHWLSRIAVEAAGGRFIKWTGDGFLAWFPFALHREIGAQSAAIFRTIWDLTVICNVTHLGVDTDKKFRLRHGVTIEHDALITQISYGRSETLDLIGRAVVLAFRLSGIKAKFPGIVTQREIAEAYRGRDTSKINFKALSINADDKLKYFKGERWSTRSLVASSDRAPRARTRASLIRSTKRVISSAEGGVTSSMPDLTTTAKLIMGMEAGPEWSRNAIAEYHRFFSEEVLGSLKSLVELLESNEQMKTK